MKKKIMIISVILLAVMAILAATVFTLPRSDIRSDQVLFYSYSYNSAWSKHSNGIFIMGNGDVYTYERDSILIPPASASALEDFVKRECLKTGHVSRRALYALYDRAEELRHEGTLTDYTIGYGADDMGYSLSYFVSPVSGPVMFREIGDTVTNTDNEELKDMWSRWNRLIRMMK